MIGNVGFLLIKIQYTNFNEEKDDSITMIAINKAEKEAISARFPDVHIVRTMKQKSKRHHYYCEESRNVTKLLKDIRATYGTIN